MRLEGVRLSGCSRVEHQIGRSTIHPPSKAQRQKRSRKPLERPDSQPRNRSTREKESSSLTQSNLADRCESTKGLLVKLASTAAHTLR